MVSGDLPKATVLHRGNPAVWTPTCKVRGVRRLGLPSEGQRDNVRIQNPDNCAVLRITVSHAWSWTNESETMTLCNIWGIWEIKPRKIAFHEGAKVQ
jgi:hypothetical protein